MAARIASPVPCLGLVVGTAEAGALPLAEAVASCGWGCLCVRLRFGGLCDAPLATAAFFFSAWVSAHS